MPARTIRFVSGEPALVVATKGTSHLVVGDLHIGREMRLSAKGIHVYGTAESMAQHILKIAAAHSLSRLILLGDIKDSIMRPPARERTEIALFFDALSVMDTTIVLGNHDAGLALPDNVKTFKELSMGQVGFVHGHALPSEKLVESRYIVAAHDHPAFLSDAPRDEKAWIVCSVNPKVAHKFYSRVNPRLEIISMPAFNPLIIGGGRAINPLFRKRIFDIGSATAYGLDGTRLRGRQQGLGRAFSP